MKLFSFFLLLLLLFPAPIDREEGKVQAQMIREYRTGLFFTPLISAYPQRDQRIFLRQTLRRGDNAVSLYYGFNRLDNPFSQPYFSLDIRKERSRERILDADAYAQRIGLRTVGWVFADQSHQPFKRRMEVVVKVVEEIQKGNLSPSILILMLEMDEDWMTIPQFHTLGKVLREGGIPILLHFTPEVWGLGEGSEEIREFWREADWASGWAVQTRLTLPSLKWMYPRWEGRMRKLVKILWHGEVGRDDSQALRDAKALVAKPYVEGSLDGRWEE